MRQWFLVCVVVGLTADRSVVVNRAAILEAVSIPMARYPELSVVLAWKPLSMYFFLVLSRG